MSTKHPTTRTAIVTGASRGLGLGIARALAVDGHQVVLVARGGSDLDAARELVGGTAIAVAADVTSLSDVQGLVAQTVDRFGGVDVLVNAAGAVPVLDAFESMSADRFREAIEVDVVGTFRVTQAVTALMRRQQRGTIVKVIAARGVPIGPAHLAVGHSQAALLTLTHNLAVILADDGIVFHALFPGLSLDGETGRVAAPSLGITLGPDSLTAKDVGAAAVSLLHRPTPGVYGIEAGGQLQHVSELST